MKLLIEIDWCSSGQMPIILRSIFVLDTLTYFGVNCGYSLNKNTVGVVEVFIDIDFSNLIFSHSLFTMSVALGL